MALVNPNIAMSFRQPEIQAPNALAQYAQVQQIMNSQQAQELARYQLGAAQRTEQRDIARTNALSQAGTDDDAIANALLKSGDLKGYSDFVKSRRETQKADVELLSARRKFGDDLKRNLSANPSDENIKAWGQDAVLQKLYTPAEVELTVQQLLALPPAERVRVLAQSGASVSDLKPTTSVGPTGIVQTSAFGGSPATVVQGTDAAFQMTPAQKEQAKRDQQRLGLEGQRVNLEGQRVQLAQEESQRKTQGLDALPPKEVQKREAAFPQATSVIKGFETKSDSFVKDLEKLRDHPGLSQITGLIAGRVPALTADGRAAQALYDKVVAKGGFQALQDLRDASKTGGALGNVSNQEGKQLTASFAAIDRRQDAGDVQAAINDAIGSVQGAKTRMREAYDSTYSYKQPATAAAPAAGANVVVTPDGQTHTFPTPAAAAQFKKAAGL
jgi:hypothetical protein